MVWASMRAIYGARFQQTYGQEPNGVWLSAIAELTDAECRAGFEKLRKGDGWPPSLPDFTAACRPRSSGLRYLGVPLTEEQKRTMLPAPGQIATPEVRDSHLARMKRLLGMEGGADE